MTPDQTKAVLERLEVTLAAALEELLALQAEVAALKMQCAGTVTGSVTP